MSVIVGGFIVMLIVTFLLPWKKVVFSKNDSAKQVIEVEATPEVHQSAVPLPEIVNCSATCCSRRRMAVGNMPPLLQHAVALLPNKQPTVPPVTTAMWDSSRNQDRRCSRPPSTRPPQRDRRVNGPHI